ncbi:uncharacterized protein LOC131670944 [Phymastichus coffea]|uniref:uncharacterized protein LOC131670944 n=1 Tax=Phymastichus coffea TaxID=108790 RepID=UPI00273BA1F5|nr:uncharacterized protein LOC131670944 [Phymastichus coffea]
MKSERYVTRKKRKTQQPVASNSAPTIGIKADVSEANFENVPSNSNNQRSRSRQTVISEYFTSPKETLARKPKAEDGEPAPIMINLPRLLNQLLNARVVLNRGIPSIKTMSTQEIIRRRSKYMVQRYCYKCKILETDPIQRCMIKICRRCDTLLVYVCTKCNVEYFVQYGQLIRHVRSCEGNNDKRLKKNVLDSITLYFCANCSFATSHKGMLIRHTNALRHKEFKGEKVIQAPRLGEEGNYRPFPVVKEDVDFYENVIKRYCPKCKTVVTGYWTIQYQICSNCQTRLLFSCDKCKYKCLLYSTLNKHAKVKCPRQGCR